MKIKEVYGRGILDSAKEKTIQVEIVSEMGRFSSSSPSGKSKGKNEKPYFLKKPEHDIIMLKKYEEKLKEYNFYLFKDLKKVEDLLKNKVGSNTLIALEISILKALASEQKKQLWQIINQGAKRFPFPVGNCIGGGVHSSGKKPDFQEFLIIPKTNNFSDNIFLMNKARELCKKELEIRRALTGENDEKALSSFLSNEEILEIMHKVKEELESQTGKKIDIGVDMASSGFYTGFVYNYKNKEKRLKKTEQINYIADLVDKYDLNYIEDPLYEEDFLGFGKLRDLILDAKPDCLVAGDDLTVSSFSRFKKAIENKSINAIILKPNQVGSLIEIEEIARLARRTGIKTIMSHRSRETLDNSLADLAFGFQADYIKAGIVGREREMKLKRMMEIEKSF